jgi:hypothetical protein
VAVEPDLPVYSTRFFCHHIQLDVPAHCLDVRPGNPDLSSTSGSPQSSQSLCESSNSRVHAFPWYGTADLDVCNARL